MKRRLWKRFPVNMGVIGSIFILTAVLALFTPEARADQFSFGVAYSSPGVSVRSSYGYQPLFLPWGVWSYSPERHWLIRDGIYVSIPVVRSYPNGWRDDHDRGRHRGHDHRHRCDRHCDHGDRWDDHDRWDGRDRRRW